MKKNDYQNLMEHIQPPAGLNDRVLSAARTAAPGAPGGSMRRLCTGAGGRFCNAGAHWRRRARRERRAGNSPAQLLLRPDGLGR